MNTPPKVLMLLPHLGTGGDWIFAQLLSKQLRLAGYEVQLGSSAGGNVGDLYSARKYLKLHQGIRGFFQSLAQISTFDRDISIIHANSINTLLFAIFLRGLRCPKATIIFTFHLYLEDNVIRRNLKAFLFSFPAYLHCSSEMLKNQIQQTYPSLKHKLVLIHLAADEETFYEVSPSEKKAYREQLNLSENELVLLFAGRLNPEKNIEIILETIALGKERYPNLKLLIAGNGPSRAKIETIINQQALNHQVRFIGYRTDMRPVYGASDLLLLPSLARETFGLVIVEAALCGTPSLRSNTPGATDQITDGVNGLVYSNHISGDFRKQFLKALEDAGKLDRMGKSAINVAKQKFTSAKMGKDFTDLYQKALRHRSDSLV
jgi:glycosyltransferase involved in cell wall biosynthesis